MLAPGSSSSHEIDPDMGTFPLRKASSGFVRRSEARELREAL
jgi:hypothetical protein